MKKEMIPLSKNKRSLVIERCAGNLTIRPIDEPVIHIKGESYDIQERDEGYVITSKSDLMVYIFPETALEVVECMGNVTVKAVIASVSLGEIHGQLNVAHGVDIVVNRVLGGVTAKHLSGQLSVGTINGDLVARHVRQIDAVEVHGDMQVKHAAGEVRAQKILGDGSFTYINGGVTVGNCMHDIHLSRIDGPVTVEAHGDIRLKHKLSTGSHQLHSHQDVVIYWPRHQPVVVSALGKRITNRFEFDEVEENDGSLTASQGKNGPHLDISADGAVVFKPINHPSTSDGEFDIHLDFDFGQEAEAMGSRMATIGEEIASKVTHKMAEITSQLEGQFKAMRKKEEAVRRASERMSRYGMPPPPPTPPKPPAPLREVDRAAVEKAKLKVLQILEAGKISIEEANTLLNALD